MLPDELETLLKAWRYAHMGPPAPLRSTDDDRTGPGSNPIARQREFAPGTKTNAEKKLAGRDGRSRRKLMAQRSGVKSMYIVPTWFVDPIRCTETRHAGPRADSSEGLPPEIRKIDRAAMDLYRIDNVKGLVLRFEYLTPGTQREKAGIIAGIIGAPLPIRVYRMHLEHARVWMWGRMAA